MKLALKTKKKFCRFSDTTSDKVDFTACGIIRNHPPACELIFFTCDIQARSKQVFEFLQISLALFQDMLPGAFLRHSQLWKFPFLENRTSRQSRNILVIPAYVRQFSNFSSNQLDAHHGPVLEKLQNGTNLRKLREYPIYFDFLCWKFWRSSNFF